MFKNFHIKAIATCAAIAFWFFVVSLENTFYRFPGEVPIQVFNLSSSLALGSQLGTVKVAVRAQDSKVLKSLTANDFEAYIELRNIGAGSRSVPVYVSSKNPQVSVVSSVPSEIEINLQPVREKTLMISPELTGEPARGYKIDAVRLSTNQIAVSGAENILQRIASAKALVSLDGSEKETVTKNSQIRVLDRNNVVLEGITIVTEAVEATVNIVEVEASKQVGVRAKFKGFVPDGTVKKVEIQPSIVSITGLRADINNVDFLETEEIDLGEMMKAVQQKTVRLVLPSGIALANGERNEVTVRVEVERGVAPVQN